MFRVPEGSAPTDETTRPRPPSSRIIRAMSDRDRLDEAVADLGKQLEDRIERLVEGMLQRVFADPSAARYDEPHLQQLARHIARENLMHEVHALQHGRVLPTSIPGEAQLAARQAVELDAPVTVVLQCYHAGHASLWSHTLDIVEGAEPTGELRRALLESVSEFMFSYVERCTSFVLAEYDRHREEVTRTRDYRWLQAVRAALRGERVGEALGDYALDAVHLGCLAWGRDARTALQTVASVGSRSLIVPGGDGTVWGWVALDPDEDRRPGELVRSHLLPTSTYVTCGTPASGPAGFRRTHREAQDARAVALRMPQPLTSYDDVALEALALVAGVRAQELVDHELRSLTETTARAQRLRETLEAYFAAGQNATSAAAILGVNERTVHNRLRAIEDVVGQDVTRRRAEIEAALRFARVLHSEPSSPGEP